MTNTILQAINGISFAALLFLLASGFTISFGLMRVVNMAHGAYYLIGGYIGLSIARATGSFTLAVIGGGLATIPIGFLVDRFLLRRVGENHLAQVLLTVGVAFVIGDAANVPASKAGSVTHFEANPGAMYLTELTQDTVSGQLTPVSSTPIDFSAVSTARVALSTSICLTLPFNSSARAAEAASPMPRPSWRR